MPLRIQETAQERARRIADDPGLGTSFAVGLRRDPLLRPVVDTVAELGFGLDEADLDELDFRVRGSTLSSAFATAGEFLPTVAGAASAFGLGRAAFTAAVRAAAPRLAARGAGSFLGRQGARIGQRVAAEEAIATGRGIASSVPNITALERGAQITGGALGEGTFTAAQEAARGSELPDVLKAGALGAALAGGTEGAASALGLLSPLVRRGDASVARGTFAERALPVLQRERARAQNTLRDLTDNLFTLTGGRELTDETLAALRTGKRGKPTKGGTRLANRARDLQRRVGIAQGRVEALESVADLRSLVDDRILRETPLAPDDGSIMEAARGLLQRYVQAPEVTAGQLGVTMARVGQLLEEAEVLRTVGSAAAERVTLRMMGQLARDVGRKAPRNLRQADDLLEDVLELAEGQGLEAVERTFGADAASTVRTLREQIDKAPQPLVERGILRLMSAEDKAANGVAEYLPQVVGDVDERVFQERLQASLARQFPDDPMEVSDRVNKVLNGTLRKRGVERFGSVDYQRLLPGTLAAKRREGLPFEGYATSISRYLSGVGSRLEYGRRFGFDNQALEKFTGGVQAAAVAEGANGRLVRSFLDTFFNQSVPERGLRRLAQNITSAQTFAKLTFASFPNLGQSVNTATGLGLRNTVRGAASAFSQADRSIALRALALTDLEFDAMRRLMGGVETTNWIDRAARASLGVTGFTVTEQLNRGLAGLTGMALINDTLARGLRGQLRGMALDRARRQLGSVGLDLDKLLTGPARREIERALPRNTDLREAIDLAVGQGTYDRAVFRAAQITQFTPGSLRVPPAWQTPLGRVLTQFKSFAFNQGRLVRDMVFAEATRGNVRPLVTFLSLATVSGEVVADVVSTLKDRKRDAKGLERLVENAATVGGFGIVQSMLVGAEQGRLRDFVLGPTVNDAVTVAESLLPLLTEFDPGRLGGRLANQPIFQGAKALFNVGVLGSEQLGDVLDRYNEDATPNTVSFEEFAKRMRSGVR